MSSAAVPGDAIGSGAFVVLLTESSTDKLAGAVEDSLDPEADGSDNGRVAIASGGTGIVPEVATSDERQADERRPRPEFFRLFPVELGFSALSESLSPGFPMIGSLLDF